jgi:hypothetical protein
MINVTEPRIQDQSIRQSARKEQLEYIPGIWLNGKCYWMQDSDEKILYDEEIIVRVKQEKFHSKIRFFNLYVSNHSNSIKDLKVLAMYHYSFASSEQFSFVSPSENVIFHLANKNIYLVNGLCNGVGISDYTIHPYWNVFTDRIWSSLEKGTLKYQPMSKGHSASILAMKLSVKPHETAKICTWSIQGTEKSELISLDTSLLSNWIE